MTRRRDLIGASLAASGLTPPSMVGASPQTDVRQLRFTMQLSNPFGHALEEQSVWFYGPMRSTGAQKLLELRASMPHELVYDELGQSILAIRLPFLAPLATRVVNISVRVALQAEPVSEPIEHKLAWLGDERYIEADDPPIRMLADELRRDDPRETAQAIYDWVRQNLTYAGYVADDLGAREALRTRRGDCTEYAYLCTALARACGIRARVMGGYVAESDVAPRVADFHNWAQLHVLGAWRTLDAQRQRWWDAREYVAFHVIANDTRLNPLGRAHRFRATSQLAVSLQR